MEAFLYNLIWTLAILHLVPTLYLILLTFAALFRRKLRIKDNMVETKKFIVLIPAHNEEKLIASTVAALHECHYPSSRLEVVVIADNCTDDTAILARSGGARVLERQDLENRGKGQALDWALRELREEIQECDYVTIIDADTIVDRLYFREVNLEFLVREVKVIQGYYGCSNVGAHWRTGLSEVAFAVSHHLRPLGRNVLGGTGGLKGNGMSFQSELLLELGWPAHSIVEDLELTIILLERGEKVFYQPSAKVAAEMVTKSDAATTQRMRWEGGRGQLFRQYGGKLLSLFFRKGDYAALDCLCDLLFPPLAIHVALCLLIGAATLLIGDSFLIALGLSPLIVTIGHVTLAMLHRGVPAPAWRSLFSVPGFLFWKGAVYLKMMFSGKEQSWIRTAREGEEAVATFKETAKPLDRLTKRSTMPSRSDLIASHRKELRRKMRWKLFIRSIEGGKRLMDIVGALAALLMLSPILLLTIVLIYLEDRGPIFFFQERVGKRGKPFTMVKFRSMRTDAEKVRKDLEEENEHDVAVTFKIKKDPRITRVGRIIRKFSIDEMPQFYNVLIGDMSLVGPRPALAKEVALYEGFQLRRLEVKPGISCLWQIQGRSDIDFEGQVRLDLEYIHSESLWRDVVILLKTVPAVVLARGAY